MQKILQPILLCAALLVTVSSSLAQTTMADYDYIARVMLIDAKAGKPVNDKYITGHEHAWTSPVGEGSTGTRKSVTSVIFEAATSRPVGILVALRRTDTEFIRTLCIPLPSSDNEVLDRAFKDMVTATSEWSTQAQTYFWHVALSFAAEVAAKSFAPTKMLKAETAIESRLNACLDKGDPDTYEWGMIHPEYGCWNTALQDWLAELKRAEGRLIALVSDKVAMKKMLDAWHAYYDNHLGAEQGLEDFGGTLYQISLLHAQITIVKARFEMIETYIGILNGEY